MKKKAVFVMFTIFPFLYLLRQLVEWPQLVARHKYSIFQLNLRDLIKYRWAIEPNISQLAPTYQDLLLHFFRASDSHGLVEEPVRFALISPICLCKIFSILSSWITICRSNGSYMWRELQRIFFSWVDSHGMIECVLDSRAILGLATPQIAIELLT